MGKKNKKTEDNYLSSDGVYNWHDPSDGLLMSGTVTTSAVDIADMGSPVTYSFGDLDTQLDFNDETLRKKYPALQDAWEHYENVKPNTVY